MEIDDQALNSTLMSQDNLAAEYARARLEAQRNAAPITNFETAKFLIDNSDVTKELSEIEKEIKLSNLPKDWALIIFSLMDVYQDQILLKEIQLKKFATIVDPFTEQDVQQDKLSPSQKMFFNSIQDFQQKKFDVLNSLRKGLTLSTLSRGLDGFERRQQNTVISSSHIDQSFDSGNKPGIFSRLRGKF